MANGEKKADISDILDIIWHSSQQLVQHMRQSSSHIQIGRQQAMIEDFTKCVYKLFIMASLSNC